MKDAKITIIGCGLLGGSAALALKRRRPDWAVACIDLAERLPAIREAGITDEVGTPEDLARHLPESSFVLLAMPVPAIMETIERIRPHLRAGAIVTDVGSTKQQIMAKAQALMPPGTHFIGGHPMAGSERSGVEAADPLLFSDRVYVLCPYPDTPADVLLSVMNLVEDLLALPITIDPEEHDRIMAMVSHLPQLIAVALMHAAQSEDATHDMLDKLAGRGFMDMTRLAASDYGIWMGILETNKAAIRESSDRFVRSLAALLDKMVAGDAALMWEEVCRRRRQMGVDSLPRMRKPDYRSIIDRCDKQILGALGHRMQVARRIGRLKSHQQAPVSDPDRERRMVAQRGEWGKALGLPPELINELFAVIIRHSTHIQATERGAAP
ncbi:MAG: prephenate dehydrogenase/arogenate dehydrogenase family protein [Acidobacteriia bacterium]|nr:prephenate dehydrogenase/arogenate dehydrogenase family protein [Terriglobia bacterium]